LNIARHICLPSIKVLFGLNNSERNGNAQTVWH
jgi:hypothetical protein